MRSKKQSNSEIKSLIKTYLETQNENLFLQIYNTLFNFIHNLANKYYRFFHTVSKDDLIEEGIIGLHKSLKHIKKKKIQTESDILAYIKSTIKRNIRNYIVKNLGILSMPYNFIKKIKKIFQFLETENKSIYEISRQLKLEPWEIRDYVSLWPKGTVYLDAEIDPEQEHLQHEVVKDTNEPEIDYSFVQQQIKNYVYKLLENLTLEEKKVLELRFGIKDGKHYSFKDIASYLGIPPRKVKEIELIALRKLKKIVYAEE
ncbi:MAG: sigma-70 family RNA polymerase sigma factor [Endomicrobia bacterium]|nr:sigma-70 family RNA polymerase sigma factor [Endomicrobiia bacterium]